MEIAIVVIVEAEVAEDVDKTKEEDQDEEEVSEAEAEPKVENTTVAAVKFKTCLDMKHHQMSSKEFRKFQHKSASQTILTNSIN